MREEDAAEVEASSGHTPTEAILASIEATHTTYAALVGDELLALFGLSRVETPRGQATRATVWALTSTAVERHRKGFYRASVRVVAALSGNVPILYNFVDARYTKAVSWLRRLGFEVLPPVPYGPRHLPFHPVVYRRHLRV